MAERRGGDGRGREGKTSASSASFALRLSFLGEDQIIWTYGRLLGYLLGSEKVQKANTESVSLSEGGTTTRARHLLLPSVSLQKLTALDPSRMAVSLTNNLSSTLPPSEEAALKEVTVAPYKLEDKGVKKSARWDRSFLLLLPRRNQDSRLTRLQQTIHWHG